MAKQLENATTVVHFPLRPFGRHAGQREIVLTYGGPDVNAYEIPPLNGCTLDDPFSDSDKARLCGLALARIDAGGRFDVDYAALRAHLRTLCGVRDEDLHGLTWGAAMAILGETPAGEPDTAHSGDYHSVRWHGQKYTFSHQQAAVVALLWAEYENGTPDLSQEHLLDKSGSNGGRLRDVFRENGAMHAAWGTMIVESRKGVFRLSEPRKKS